MFSVHAVAVGDSIQQGLDKLFAFLPNLIGALIILAIGYVIARIVRTLVAKLLSRAGLDGALRSGKAGSYVARATQSVSASGILASVAFWVLFLGTLSLAAAALQIGALSTLIGDIYAYLPNVLAALVIFLLASVVAAAAGGLVSATMGDTPTARIAGSVVPILVMAIAAFMILNQLQIAPEIVTITYTALIGSAALGLALAFGLGGREAAGKLVSDAFDRARHDTGNGAPAESTGRFTRETRTSGEKTAH